MGVFGVNKGFVTDPQVLKELNDKIATDIKNVGVLQKEFNKHTNDSEKKAVAYEALTEAVRTRDLSLVIKLKLGEKITEQETAYLQRYSKDLPKLDKDAGMDDLLENMDKKDLQQHFQRDKRISESEMKFAAELFKKYAPVISGCNITLGDEKLAQILNAVGDETDAGMMLSHSRREGSE